MMNSDLHPPRTGLNADPVLYGVAAGLATLFPPIRSHGEPDGQDARPERDEREERHEAE